MMARRARSVVSKRGLARPDYPTLVILEAFLYFMQGTKPCNGLRWDFKLCCKANSNTLAVIGMVAQYVTEDGQLQHRTLASKNIDSGHDGPHFADAILDAVEDWGFASKLGDVVMNNVDNLIG